MTDTEVLTIVTVGHQTIHKQPITYVTTNAPSREDKSWSMGLTEDALGRQYPQYTYINDETAKEDYAIFNELAAERNWSPNPIPSPSSAPNLIPSPNPSPSSPNFTLKHTKHFYLRDLGGDKVTQRCLVCGHFPATLFPAEPVDYTLLDANEADPRWDSRHD